MIEITENQITILYRSVNEMMAILGRDGEINTRHYAVMDVMTALELIDGGGYDDKSELKVTK